MTAMATVSKCATTSCSFNHDGCNAFAMTMGGKGCVTFVELNTRGGLDHGTAQVGACQRTDCKFNKNLECAADSVNIGASTAECLTFERA